MNLLEVHKKLAKSQADEQDIAVDKYIEEQFNFLLTIGEDVTQYCLTRESITTETGIKVTWRIEKNA